MMKRMRVRGRRPGLRRSGVRPDGSPRGEAKATVAGKAVSIDYGRPSLKGRDMLGQAQVGQAWRMGADAATSLKTDADLSFGAANVPKGEYILTATKVVGRPVAPQRRSTRTTARRSPTSRSPPRRLPQPAEQFTIDLTGAGDKGTLKMTWGTTALETAFTGK